MGPSVLVLSCKSYLEALDRSDWLTPGSSSNETSPWAHNLHPEARPSEGQFFITASRNEPDRTDPGSALQNHVFEFINECMLSHLVIPPGFWRESNGIRPHSGASLAGRLLPSVLMGAEQPRVCYKKAGRIRSGISFLGKGRSTKLWQRLCRSAA